LSGARDARGSRRPHERVSLVRAGGAVYDSPAVRIVRTHTPAPQVADVFSLLGVLGIALILFVLVAVTAGFVLGE
jgi:hypothetical protein